MKQSFYGGVHPNDRKELARHKEVAPLSAAPKQVVIAMAMHVGAPCKPIVAVGDQVKVGQKIGEIAGLGAPIHASRRSWRLSRRRASPEWAAPASPPT